MEIDQNHAAEMTAARKIQTFWKNQIKNSNTTKQIFTQYKTTTNISVTQLRQNNNPEQMMQKFNNKETLCQIKKAATRALYISYGQKQNTYTTTDTQGNQVIRPTKTPTAALNPRVVASAYMIKTHPEKFFTEATPETTNDEELQQAAESLTEIYDTVVEILATQNAMQLTNTKKQPIVDYEPTLNRYCSAFKKWKIIDEQKIVNKLKHLLKATYQAQQQQQQYSTQDQDDFNQKINNLRYKIQNVAGEECRKRIDRELGKDPNIQPVEPKEQPQTTLQNTNTTNKNQVRNLSNEQLAHELMLNENFKMDIDAASPKQTQHEQKIQELCQESYWNAMQQELAMKPPVYNEAIIMLEIIKESLQEITENTPHRDKITAVINKQNLREQTKNNTFTWKQVADMAAAIYEIITKIQTKQRQQENTEMWQKIQNQLQQAEENPEKRPEAFCNMLKAFLHATNILRVDVANERLKMILPIVKLHGIEYERAHFERKLANGTITLENMTNAVENTIDAEIAAENVTIQQLAQGREEQYRDIHTAMVLSLVTADEEITIKNVPETLQLDLKRLQRTQEDFKIATVLIPVLMQIQIAIAQKKDQKIEILKEAIETYVQKQTQEPTNIQMLQQSLTHHIIQYTKLPEDNNVIRVFKNAWETIKQQKMQNNQGTTAKIFMGPKGRTAAALAAKVKGIQQTPTKKIPIYAQSPLQLLQKHAHTLRELMQLDLRVHVNHYNNAISNAVKKRQRQDTEQEVPKKNMRAL